LPNNSVANIKFPDDYVKNGLKNKLKMPANIKVEYSSGYLIKIKKIKIYEHSKLLRVITFRDYENFKDTETIYFYDNNSTAYTSKITREYNTSDEILDYEIAKDAKDNDIYTKYFYRESVKDKGKILSLRLHIQHNPEITHWLRYSRDKRVEAEGYLIKRGRSRGSFKRYFNKKGIIVKEYSYHNGLMRDNILDGFYYTYDDNGTLKSEKYYDDGKYKYGSYCKFNTTIYVNRLEKKYAKKMLYTRRADTHCQKISDSIYAIATAYDYEDEDNFKKANLILSVVNIKTKEIITDRYDENTKLKNPSYMTFFANNSYDAQNSSDIFDFVSSNGSLISYKITANSIELLDNITYNLKDILQSVKENKNLNIKNINALLKEVKIDSKTLETYNDIAYYLQKNGHHKGAMLILLSVLDRYPNRVVAYINMADSLYALDKKTLAKIYYKDYIKWMKFYKQERKIPKYLYKRIK